MKKLILSKENKQINNSIIENNKFIRNFSNCKLEMKNTLTNNDFITLNKDNKIIKMNYINKARNIIKGIQEDNKIIYPSIEDGVDLKYEVLDNKLKESIVINELQDNYQYDFELDIGDLIPSFNKENNTLELKENDKIIYRLLSPYMVDNKKDYSNDCAYEIEQNENKLNIKLTCSNEWINSPNRTLPIIIDPTIEIYNDELFKAEQYIDNVKQASYSTLTVGYDDIVKNNVITQRKYLVKYIFNLNAIKNKYEINKIYNTEFQIKPFNFLSTNFAVRVNVNGVIKTLRYAQYSKGIDISLMDYINNGIDKVTVILEPYIRNNTYTSDGIIRYGFNIAKPYSDESNESTFQIYYKERQYLQKQTYEINKKSKINIFLEKPNYQFEHLDTTISDNKLSIDIKHILDGESKYNNEVNYLGEGWKLNIYQTIKSSNINRVFGSKEYIYTDGYNNKTILLEKWYYLKDNEEIYVHKEDVYLDDDNKLKTIVNNEVYEVKYSLEDEDKKISLINLSNLNNFNNSNNLNNEEEYYLLIGNYKFYCLRNKNVLNVPEFNIKVNDITHVLSYSEIEYKDGSFLYKEDNSKPLNMSFFDIKINFDEDGIYINHAVGQGSNWELEKVRIYLENKYKKVNKYKDTNVKITEEIENLNNQIYQLQTSLDNFNNQLELSTSQYNLYDYQETYKKVYNLDNLKNKIKEKRDIITNAITDTNTKNNQIYYDEASDEYEENYKQYEKNVLNKRKEIEEQSIYNSYSTGIDYVKMLNKLIKQRDELILEQYKEINYVLIDKDNNLLCFDGYGQLVKIKDKYENEINIEFNYEDHKNNQIKRIYSSTEEIKLNYENDLLTSLIDNKGRILKFKYYKYQLSNIVYSELDKNHHQLKLLFEGNESNTIIKTPIEDIYLGKNENTLYFRKDILNPNNYISSNTIIEENIEKVKYKEFTYNYLDDEIIVKDNILEEQVTYYKDENGNIYASSEIDKDGLEKYHYSYIENNLTLFKTYLINNTKIEEGEIVSELEEKTFTFNELNTILCLSLSFNGKQNVNIKIESGKRKFIQEIKVNKKETINLPFFADTKNIKITFSSDIAQTYKYRIYNAEEGELYTYENNKLIQKQTVLYNENYKYEDDLLVKVINKSIFDETLITTYFYNSNRQLKAIEDSNGNVEEYYYDDKLNVIEKRTYNKENASLMQVEKNNYNKKGLMISKTGNIKNKDNKYPTQEIKYVNNLINKVIDYKSLFTLSGFSRINFISNINYIPLIR